MLQIQNISKKYKTGDLVQTALDDVTMNLRDNEFVAILGPSGSGKTTLLNVIGGLDRYDSGDLIINGISTKKYKDRDWDSYRNHTIGFVFQSYNLIPHQTILANVELALTISGIGRAERKKRAIEALGKVGLGDQLHKRPNQMSGGQMQRVAIARALINNPDVLLADEPTGALDTETSVQVMELLKEVAKDRLVVMVTHNPELAETYATRIVRLQDGHITDDSNPYEVVSAKELPAKHKNMGKSSMSLLTSLSLSFNNLRTKKGRTLLTSFAGSIGIIGIALILSLSNGVNTYIEDLQKDTMTSYPITIAKQTMDISSFIGGREEVRSQTEHELDGVYSNGRELKMASNVTSSITENNLEAFKQYLDNPESAIHSYIGESGIVYSYDTQFNVYTYDSNHTLVNTDGSTFETIDPSYMPTEMSQMMSFGKTENNNFKEILPDQTNGLVGTPIKDSYDVLYGNWPTTYNEVVLVLDENNELSLTTLYELGMLPANGFNELMEKMNRGEEVSFETQRFSYEEFSKVKLYMVPACDTYVKNDNGTYDSMINDPLQMESLMNSSIELKIVGIVRNKEDASATIGSSIGYTKQLTDYLIDYTNNSDVVKAQQADTTINILNGLSFHPTDDSAKVSDAKTYLSNLGVTDKANMCKNILSMMSSQSSQLTQIMDMGEIQIANMFDSYMETATDEVLLGFYDRYVSTGNYEDNMKAFGVVDTNSPNSISIYADSFEDKDAISTCIKNYNATVTEENQITYTDAVALLMSSITTIVNVISYVLIAFVAVSLIVSSIMIGIITYISVLERTKEIGILRAIGASKHNISRVFNAETFIIGLCAGVMGILITLLLLIPINSIIHAAADSSDVSAALPGAAAIILIILSMILTLIGGLIPSKKAAKKDPVTALRTE